MNNFLKLLILSVFTLKACEPVLAQTKVDGAMLKGDIVGGAASNTKRLIAPQGSTSALNALTRSKGNLVIDSTTNKLKYDNGTSLVEVTNGTVTSVGIALPTSVFSNGAAVTSSGDLTAALQTQTANTVFAGPSSGGASAPTFRALSPADLPANTRLIARMASTAAFNTTYDNGILGIGATLTNLSPLAALSIDGVTAVVGDYVLVKNQTNGFENGLYVVTNIGSGVLGWVLTRATSFDNSIDGPLYPGATIAVSQGTENAGYIFMLQTAGVYFVGTTNLVFLNSTHNTLLTGLGSNQTVIGATTSGGTLTLQSTSNATKGKILFGTSAYDEVNNRLGIGTTTPVSPLHVSSAGSVRTWVSGVDNTVNSSTSIWNSQFVGTVARNTSTTVGALSGFQFSLGTGGNATSGVAGVQETASSLAGIAFFTGGAGVSNTTPERMRINSSGNIGIGTTTINTRLTVSGNADISGSLGLGDTTPATNAKALSIVGGTLATTGVPAVNITATLPATPAAHMNPLSITVTGSGSASTGWDRRAVFSTLAAGYTGTDGTSSGYFVNLSAGTGSDIFGNYNRGLVGASVGTTTGTNVGVQSGAAGGNINYGTVGVAVTAKNSAVNVGVIGLGLNTGTTPTQVGGYFGLANAAPTHTSAALVADNGSTTSPIFLARDSGSVVAQISNGGNAFFGGSTTPTAKVHLAAGTATANTAPLKLTSGVNLTTPEAGAIEYDGTNLYYTDGTATRRTLASTVTASTTLSPNIQKYTSGSGTYGLSYWFTVSSATATAGATYTNNSNTFTVARTVSGSSVILLTSNGAPLTSGTLTKASGTGDTTITFTKAQAPLYIRVKGKGAGGGGAGSSTVGAGNGGSGGAGGNTTFGSSLLVGNGGAGGVGFTNYGGVGGTASLGTGPIGTATQGQRGQGASAVSTMAGGQGGGSKGGVSLSGNVGTDAIANSGCGGGGAGSPAFGVTGSGGGEGGEFEAVIYDPSATYAFAIGAAGTAGAAGTSGFNGGVGASGSLEIFEAFQ